MITPMISEWECVVRLADSYRKTTINEPAPATWFASAVLMGAALLMIALLNVAPI
jgi:hypothetical protein